MGRGSLSPSGKGQDLENLLCPWASPGASQLLPPARRGLLCMAEEGTCSVSMPLLQVRARGRVLRGSPAALGSSRTAQDQGRRAARHSQPCSSHTTSHASLASWDPQAAWPGWDDALAPQWKADSQDFSLWPAKWFLSSCQAWKSSFPSTKQERGWARCGRWGSAPVSCCSQILCSQVILRLQPWLCLWPGGTGGFVWLQSSEEGMGAAVLCW